MGKKMTQHTVFHASPVNMQWNVK